MTPYLSFEVLILIMLATWRLSHMLAYESGVFGVLSRLRFHAGAYPHACDAQLQDGMITNILCCVNCLSLWVAPVVFLLWLYAPVFVWILAVSAGAMLLQRVR